MNEKIFYEGKKLFLPWTKKKNVQRSMLSYAILYAIINGLVPAVRLFIQFFFFFFFFFVDKCENGEKEKYKNKWQKVEKFSDALYSEWESFSFINSFHFFLSFFSGKHTNKERWWCIRKYFFFFFFLLLLFCHISINYTHTDKYTYGRQIFFIHSIWWKDLFLFHFFVLFTIFMMTMMSVRYDLCVMTAKKKNWSYVVIVVAVVVVNQVKVNEFENSFFRRGKTEKIFFLSNSNCTLNEQEMKRKKWSKPKLWSIIYRIVFCFFSFIHCLENTHRLMMLATIIMMMMMIGCDGQKKFHFFCHLKIPKNSGYHHHHDHSSMMMHLIFMAVYSILSYRWKDKHLIVHR